MKIFITGGTGLIGSTLIQSLLQKDYEVTVYVRNIDKAKQKFGTTVQYCISLDNDGILENFGAVINLAGESIAKGRWNEKRKQLLCDSRWTVTQKLVKQIKNCNNPPQVLISGSAIGFYGSQKDTIITEESTPHNEFTHQLCKQWEEYALEAQSDTTRICLLRTGIVLSKEGGMLPKMILPFKLGLGAILGSGQQYISWIHIHDMVSAIIFLLENPDKKGAYNMSSPNPVTNKYFSKTLAHILHRPCIFKIPSFLISLVAGEASTLILDGQRAYPQRLVEDSFQFEYPKLEDALRKLL